MKSAREKKSVLPEQSPLKKTLKRGNPEPSKTIWYSCFLCILLELSLKMIIQMLQNRTTKRNKGL